MLTYAALPESNRNSLAADHPRGDEIIQAIELDLTRSQGKNATRLPNGRFALVYTPPVTPALEIRIVYLFDGNSIHIKVFDVVQNPS